MQTRLGAFVAVIVVLALAIGATMGYTLVSQKISTVTDTQTITETKSPNSTVSTIKTETITQTIVSTTVLQTSTSSTTTSTSTYCSISAEGSGTYVTVVSDAGQPLQEIQISGIIVTQVGTNGGCQQNIGIYLTNSTGTALITPNTGSYYLLSIAYGGRNYTATAPIDPMQSTYVTLKVPSGNVSISEIPFGGCLRNATATVCPGKFSTLPDADLGNSSSTDEFTILQVIDIVGY